MQIIYFFESALQQSVITTHSFAQLIFGINQKKTKRIGDRYQDD